ERAVADNHATEAVELAKALTLKRDYVAASDREKCGQLLERTRIWEGAAPAASGSDPGGQGADALARSKLAQARALLAQGRFDTADQLAQEVEAMQVTFSASELTPHKLREEIASNRKDARFLLTAGRTAFNKHDLDQAEYLAKEADSNAKLTTF